MGYPNFLDHSPPNNFIGAVLDTPVFFRVEDSDGLDTSTLRIIIEGVDAVIGGVYQTGFSGTITNENHIPTAISVVVVKSTDFNYSQEVNVAAEIDDQLGTKGNNYWKFLTIPDPDKTAPLVEVNPHGGLYDTSQSVTLTGSEPVTIYYTLDETDPNLSSLVYSSPISIAIEGKTILKFVGIDEAGNYDDVRIEEYVLDFTVPTTIADPLGGDFFSSQQVSLIPDDTKATTFFTINNTIPTTSSQIYSLPISIPNNQQSIIKFFSQDQAGNSEFVKTEIYNIEIAKNNIIVKNVHVRHAYIRNELQIIWEDMYPIYTERPIVGYNIYRAETETNSEYLKLNHNVITVNQYIDKTLDTEIVQEDVSEQFRRTVNISRKVDDSFNGKFYDETKWQEYDPIQLMFQYDGVIFTDKTGLNQEAKLISKYKLQDDFEIQIVYDLKNWLIPNTTISSCIFRVKKDDGNFIQVARERSQTANVYSSNKTVNGNPDLPITISTVDEYGAFKIKRNGNVISTYFVDNTTGNDILVQSFNSFTDDLYIEIVGKSADVPTEFSWNNFQLNEGRAIIIEPLNSLREYVIQVSRIPIVDSSGTNKITDDLNEVEVTIDGQRAYLKQVGGYEGQVYLETDRVYDEILKDYFTPPVPNEYSIVLVTYKTPLHTTKINLRKNYFYKITAITPDDETDLDVIIPSYLQTEELSYIYEEAIRRNAWLRDQGGERVLVYIQKRAGEICSCTQRDMKPRSHRKPDQDCSMCFGSGFVGGFFGPIPIAIGNLTSEHRIQQTERGLHLVNQVETWTGPFPVLTQRDMMIRRNGDRCLIGPITKTDGPGGVLVQQNFSIETLDATDIRYTFPIQPLPNQFVENTTGIDKQGIKVPEVTSAKERESLVTGWDSKADDDEIPSKKSDRNKSVDAEFRNVRPRRGRSIKFENIHF